MSWGGVLGAHGEGTAPKLSLEVKREIQKLYDLAAQERQPSHVIVHTPSPDDYIPQTHEEVLVQMRDVQYHHDDVYARERNRGRPLCIFDELVYFGPEDYKLILAGI